MSKLPLSSGSLWRQFPVAIWLALGFVILVNIGFAYVAEATFPGEVSHGSASVGG
jgi:hypothetical protein